MGAVPDHDPTEAVGGVDDSVNRYPVTPTLSVAVNVETVIVNDVAFTGIVKAVTVGWVSSL